MLIPKEQFLYLINIIILQSTRTRFPFLSSSHLWNEIYQLAKVRKKKNLFINYENLYIIFLTEEGKNLMALWMTERVSLWLGGSDTFTFYTRKKNTIDIFFLPRLKIHYSQEQKSKKKEKSV